MNDRFKFRVWDIKQQKYRQRTHHEADTCLNCLTGKVLFGEGIEIYGEEEDKDVIPEQCTGLKDKNGKLIYENDIIDTPNGIYRVAVDDFGLWTAIYKGNPLKDVVEWSDIVKNYAFNKENVKIVILGNIHQDKELLDE